MGALLKRWRITLLLLLIHAVAVCVVYVRYTNSVTHTMDTYMQWYWLSLIDFPSSILLAILQPQYGLQSAAAFFVVGGIQWFIVGAILDALFGRRRENNT